MPKVTITGSTEQVLEAMGYDANPVVRRIAKPGTNERARKNKMRGDAQKTLCAAFKIVRNDPTKIRLRDDLLAAISNPKMPEIWLLGEAEAICAENT